MHSRFKKLKLCAKMSKSWTEEQLDLAIEQVKSKKLSLNRAAKVFGIPPTSLHRHVHGEATKVGAGRPTTLTYEEEKEIVYICQVSLLIAMQTSRLHFQFVKK